ncbi:MAG: choice-of-anchor J domain-containing protein [Bacteroidales bacterium]
MKFFYKSVINLLLFMVLCGSANAQATRGGVIKNGEKEISLGKKKLSFISEKSYSRSGAKVFDDFESHEDFSTTFGDWVVVDKDKDVTYSYPIDFPHEQEPMSFMVMNPLTVEPPATFWTAHSGNKFLVALSCVNKINDDWLISPKVTTGEHDVFSFWAKSQSSGYGLERFQVWISTSASTNPDDFVMVTEGEFIKAPATEWKKYQYDLNEYADQDIRVAIRCVSKYATFFMVDDVKIAPVPTEPSCDLNYRLWNADTIRYNSSVNSGKVFSVTNYEGGKLNISSVTDLSNTNFSTTFNKDEVDLARNESYNFGFTYHPDKEGKDSVAFVIQSNAMDKLNDTIYLKGWSYYLPDGTVEIGKGKVIDVKCPIANYYNYSFGQSIYTADELGLGAGELVDRIQLRYKGYDPSYNHIKVYLKHTDKDKFTSKSDWVALTEDDIVYNNMISLGNGDKWVTINLSKKFRYDGSKNIVIGLEELSDFSVPYREEKKNGFYVSKTPKINDVDYQKMSLHVFSDDKPLQISQLRDAFSVKDIRPNIRFFFNKEKGPKLVASPNDLKWDYVASGTSHERRIELYNSGNESVNVSNISFGNDVPLSFSETSFDIAPEESKTIIATYTPQKEGPFEGKIVFESNSVVPAEINFAAEAYRNGYLYEDFENCNKFNFPPEGWSIKGNNKNWELGYYSVNAYDKRQFAFSDPGSDYLVSPEMIVRPGDKIVFYAKGLQIPFPKNAFAAYWSTNKLDWHSFPPVELNSSYLNLYKRFEFEFPKTAEGKVYVGFQRKGDLGEIYIDRVIGPQLYRHGNDLKVMSITGSELPALEQETQYTVKVKNNGKNVVATYKLQLLDAKDNVLSERDGITLKALKEVEVPISWTPKDKGEQLIKARIVCDIDENKKNNSSELLTVFVQSKGSVVCTIKDDSKQGNTPINPGGTVGITQTILLKEELGKGGYISGFAFKNIFKADFLEKRIFIYISETDQTDLKAGFIPIQEQKLVFDKRVSMKKGIHTAYIPLTTPYLYKGRNLVVTFYKIPDSETLFSDSKFFGVYDKENPSRNRTYSGGLTGFDLNNLSLINSNIFSFIPYTRVVYARESCGSFKGTLKTSLASKDVVSDVKLRIPSLDIETVSDSEGNFTFPMIPVGNYKLEIRGLQSKDKDVEFSITAGEVTDLEISLTLRPTASLVGTLHPSYNPMSSLTGVKCVLKNDIITYEATSNSNGNISFNRVLCNYDYELIIEYKGFQIEKRSISVKEKNINFGDIVLKEEAYPCILPLAKEKASGEMEVKWFKPNEFSDYVFRHDDGQVRHHSGYFEKPNGLAGAAYKVKAYLKEVEFYLQKSGFVHSEARVYIFGLDEDGKPNREDLLYQSPFFSCKDDVWTKHILPNPVYAPNGFYLAVNTGTIPQNLGADDGVGDPYPLKAKTMFMSPDWTDKSISWREMGGDQFPYNFMIRANGYKIGEVEISKTRGRIGYSVYRGISGDEANYKEWEKLTSSKIANNSFVDPGWKDISQGVYRYAVLTHYDNGVNSDAIFSNEVAKDMLTSFDVEVSVNTKQDSPVGAIVSLVNNDGVFYHSYKQTITDVSGKLAFKNIWKGSYKLRIEKPDFKLYDDEDFDMSKVTNSLKVELEEVVSAPFGMYVVNKKDYKADVNWVDVNIPIQEFYEELDAFGSDFGNWKTLDRDGGKTYEVSVCDFPDEGKPAGFKVFAPNETTPAIFLYVPEFAPYRGGKYAISFSGPDKQNDDWLISPQITAGTGTIFSFHAKSAEDRYGKDRFRVYVSTKTDAVADFEQISEGDYIEANKYYDRYEFDLSKYSGKQIYVAVQCISAQTVAFCLDQIYIGLKSQYVRSGRTRDVKGFNFFFEDFNKPIAKNIKLYKHTLEKLEHGKKYNVGVSKVFASGESEIVKKSFVYNVVENVPPVITSKPVLKAAISKEYKCEIQATDYNDDELSYSLTEAPEGFELVQEGSKYIIVGTPTKLGKYTVKWEVSDGAFSANQTYELEVLKSVGLNEFNCKPVEIYPNPCFGQLNINNAAASIVQVIGVDGRIYKTIELDSNSENISLRIPAGNYTLKIQKDGVVNIQKLIIQ